MLTTRDLTTGEKLRLMRRREKMTIPEAARSLEISVYRYRMWEQDEEVPPRGSCLKPTGKLLPHEKCFLLRLREDMTMKAVAEDLGVCNYWLRQMENGEVDSTKLREYWGV